MASLAIWLGDEDGAPSPVRSMTSVLRIDRRQNSVSWDFGPLSLGIADWGDADAVREHHQPAVSPDRRFALWIVGEIYDAAGLAPLAEPGASRTLSFREDLLRRFIAEGIDIVRRIDGEYLIVLWDDSDRTLTIANDRFGALPLYRARPSSGLAFASGVRGVMNAPGVRATPDADALREAVTFGGYRLGDRTNVADVKMIPPATIIRAAARMDSRHTPYWRWTDLPRHDVTSIDDAVDTVRTLWRASVKRRLGSLERHGQTLSGGLDSRAILAEGSSSSDRWAALTFGIPGCDDMIYARKAAERAGAQWHFYPLYGEGWLERRLRYVQHTDGMIDLPDLQHLESLHVQTELMDTHLSGYIGDAVSGSTFDEVRTVDDILNRLPFYETAVGIPRREALDRISAELPKIGDAPSKFVLFDHKIQQSTNRWTAAYRNWLTVRRPFVDYQFFDFCQGLPREIRAGNNLHERWLLSTYPDLFRDIPNQKTGVPIGSSKLRWQATRGFRFARRIVQRQAARVGLHMKPRIRNFNDDGRYWSFPDVRRAIEETILGAGSIVCDILGRENTRAVVQQWFTAEAVPAQVIGSMFVFQKYHAGLTAHLREMGGE